MSNNLTLVKLIWKTSTMTHSIKGIWLFDHVTLSNEATTLTKTSKWPPSTWKSSLRQASRVTSSTTGQAKDSSTFFSSCLWIASGLGIIWEIACSAWSIAFTAVSEMGGKRGIERRRYDAGKLLSEVSVACKGTWTLSKWSSENSSVILISVSYSIIQSDFYSNSRDAKW